MFDTTPIANLDLSAPVRVSQNPDDDEDPTIVLARDGQFHVAWSAKQRGRANLVMRSSRDGRTWSDERKITDGPQEDYYPSLVQSRDGTLHLAWFRLQRLAGRRDIWYSGSKDGRQWTRPVAITNQGRDWAPALYEDARGTLWIIWSSGRTNNRELFAVRSEDGGHNWSSPQQLTRSTEENDFPHVIEKSAGERVLVWTRYRAGSSLADYFKDGSSEIVMATSRDGVNWSAPVVVSPADPEARYVDFIPHVFSNHDRQRTYVSWTSGRPGPEGGILARDLSSNASPVLQLTTNERSGYSGKIIATPQQGEYLMVWTGRDGKLKIFARRFRL